jgi:hypothetical protein
LTEHHVNVQLKFTPAMQQRLTQRNLAMIQTSLSRFPELNDSTITVGYTRKHLGSATVIYRKGELLRLIIRLRARKVTYQTIGHELTHLVQGLSYGARANARAKDPNKIPSGETQCDIWTLARDPLFCDDPPTYIKLPRRLREHWPDYAEAVRDLCIAAIEKRHTQRQYIRWLEREIRQLMKSPKREKSSGPAQLFLPFVI